MNKPKEQFSYEQLDLLYRIAGHLAAATDQNRTLSSVLNWMNEDCGWRRGVITLMNEGGEEVQASLTSKDVPSAKSERMRYRHGEGVTGQVFSSGESVYIPDLSKDRSFLDRSGLRSNIQLGDFAFFCVPIKYHETIIGTISADKMKSEISQPESEIAFLQAVANLLAPFVQRRRLERQLEVYQKAREPGGAFERMIGKSAAIQEVQKMLARVATANTTVLITGETGTGKGVAAEIVHNLSPRADNPFVEINCGSIPENLIESELFGHEKGAFTGAIQQRIGILERAGSGTVFLDEIGELSLSTQTRLLRVLQKKEFERVGGSKTMRCHARIIAATNRNLEEDVAQGNFRTDLFYRLNVFPIRLPPLRERGKSDIMLLIEHFTSLYARDMDRKIARIDTPAIDMLTAYHWPGNVRELENVIERAILLADSDVIHGHHLPPSLQMRRYSSQPETEGAFPALVENYEKELITEALKDCNGNQSEAARQLGITKRIIQYKIQKYDLDYRRFR